MPPQNCESVSNPAEVESLFTGEPEIRMGKLSSLRSLGYTPLTLTGAFLQLFRAHLADPNNIQNPRLRDYLNREGVWSSDESSSIYVEALTQWKPEKTEQRPAVLVKENDWNMERVVIDDIAAVDWETGQVTYCAFWKGSHTIFVIGVEPAETQILAVELTRLLVWFRQVIREDFCLRRFGVIQMGGPTSVKESREHYMVPITVAYLADEVWSTQQEAPRLKHIQYQIENFPSFGIG